MYIDFHKYNYDLVPADKKAEYIKRDQESYKQVLQKWFSDNLDKTVERKWEINEIHYLKNISDFIKLIREGGHAGVKNHLPPEQTDHLSPVKMVNPLRSKLTTP